LNLPQVGSGAKFVHDVHAARELLDNAIVRDSLIDHRAMMGDMSSIITGTEIRSINVSMSRHRPEVQVIPVQHFVDEFVARNVVTGFVLNGFLLLCLRTEQVVERNLGGFDGEEKNFSTLRH
jgi:hypothetical protein